MREFQIYSTNTFPLFDILLGKTVSKENLKVNIGEYAPGGEPGLNGLGLGGGQADASIDWYLDCRKQECT